MRLLNEVTTKEIDFKKEVEVALTLQDLAVIYAVIAEESTNSAEGKLRRKGLDKVADSLDCFTNDVSYNLYITSETILKAVGVKISDREEF
jgi:hypothetical protein